MTKNLFLSPGCVSGLNIHLRPCHEEGVFQQQVSCGEPLAPDLVEMGVRDECRIKQCSCSELWTISLEVLGGPYLEMGLHVL